MKTGNDAVARFFAQKVGSEQKKNEEDSEGITQRLENGATGGT